MVAGAKGAIADTAGHADDLDIHLGIGDIHFDLLRGAQGIEAGRPADKGSKTRVSQPRRHADGVLLGDADFHKLLGQLLGKISQGDGAAAVRGHGKDMPVLLRRFQQR